MAALPHLAADPVAAAGQIITALQSIVARNVSPLEAAVVSVTQVRAGETFNVIPSEAEMQGTIRSFDPGVRQTVLERFPRLVNGIAEAMGCRAEISLSSLTPAVVNDAQVTQVVWQAALQALPEMKVESGFRTMGSEDMAFMMQDIPGCYFFLGSANAGLGLDAPHHHPRFDIDERVLPQAAALMAAAAAALLR